MKNKIKRFLSRLSPNRRYYICSIIFLAITSVFLTWFLEYRYFINETWRVWWFILSNPAPFFYNAFLVFLLTGMLWALLGKPSNATTFMALIITGITFVHINKYNSRGFPLLPEDFQLAGEAGSLANFVSVSSIIKLIIAMIIMVVLCIIFNRKIAKRLYLVAPKHSKKLLTNNILVARGIILTISILGFVVATDFVRNNDGSRYEDIFLGTHFTAWNQNRNYDDNGFILGFLYNLQKLNLSTPDDYSEEFIAGIYNEYSREAEKSNQSRISSADEDVSVVVILNESFFDPEVSYNGESFSTYYPHEGGEILPNLRKIQSKYPSGYMYSLDYGGGTANIEFETFTGLTNYWVNTVPYTALIPKTTKVPSIASDFKKSGYETSAIHPFNGGMYHRSISLKKEGFDEFISDLEMKNTEHDGESQYINDRSAYKETIEKLKSSENNQVIGLITMQNHTPYDSWIYENRNYPVTANDIDEETRGHIETYYQSLHNSDKYLGEFIDELEKLDKKVAVLFFGDHSAGIFDKTNNSESKNVRSLSRLTPYFIYTNYETKYATKKLPTTTPNCMINTMYNTLNWQKTTRYYLLDDVCEEEPILTQTFIEDKDLSDSEILRKYHLLTYDILGGERYWRE